MTASNPNHPNLNTRTRTRYLTDPMFHARVQIVARALWTDVCYNDLGHQRPFPYDQLAEVTQDSLISYAIAAIEALERFESEMKQSPDLHYIEMYIEMFCGTGTS
jgi:hypothetical protein